jgi:hypothetical protein
MIDTHPAKGRRIAPEEITDLRRVEINPDFCVLHHMWRLAIPVAVGGPVRGT